VDFSSVVANLCESRATTTVLWSFYQDNPGEVVPEKDLPVLVFVATLVGCWNSPALTSQCMTAAGWLAVATQMKAREPDIPPRF